MTANDRFDPFEQRITDALGDIAPARRPDYLADVFAVTARTSQRPRWSFPGRWVPALDTPLGAGPARASMRPLLLVGILALLVLAATAIVLVGSSQRVPFPVGPARNGAIIYASDGDLYARQTITADGSPLVATSAKEYAPYLSPDGRRLVFARVGDGGDYLWAADIDGSNPRQLLPEPLGEGWSQWSWALDSAHLLVSGDFGGTRRLYDVAADGSGAREITFDGLVPWDAFWSPVDPDTFLLRAQKSTGVMAQDLYLSDASGRNLRPLGLEGQSAFGPQYTLSGETWSPDGKTIAYNAITLDPDSLQTLFRVHFVNADGTDDRLLPLPDEPDVHQGWPVFSPDGTQVLVQRWRFASAQGATDAEGWIAVLPADGSSNGRDIGYRVQDTATEGTTKVWSPDGTQVIQFVDDGARSFLVDPVSGAFTELTWADDFPDWQRLAP